MKKSFTLGAVSGITALAMGFPIAAQFAGAQGIGSSSAGAKGGIRSERRAPLSQDDVQEMIDHDNQFLLHVDALVAIQKEATQNHRIALQAAADIVDETARNEAVKAANDAMHKEIEDAVEADPELKDLKMPFGKGAPRGGHGFGGKGPGGRMGPPQELLDALGMTAEELKAAIDSGKTIDQIAEEKGVELPARPPMRGGMMPEPDDASGSQR